MPLEGPVHMSCEVESVDENVQGITMITLSQHDDAPIAYLSTCSNITFRSDLSSQLQVEGYINNDLGKSLLNVTFLHPKTKDTGTYRCVMHYIDQTGRLKVEAAEHGLIVQKMDLDALETMLSQMKDKITMLENKNNELSDKAAYLSAFAATNLAKKVSTSNGKDLILPDIIMRQGPGYDEKTGVFTAPTDGLYVFHFTADVNGGCWFTLSLVVNGVVLEGLFAYDKDVWAQSSTSAVKKLSVGDKVNLRTWHDPRSSCSLYEGRLTVFTGYLIKAL